MKATLDEEGNYIFPSKIEIWLNNYWRQHIAPFEEVMKNKEMEAKVHSLINHLLVEGENEISGKVSSIHQKEGLNKHLSSI